MGASASKLRFAVLQVGARMHYAVPVLLQNEGMFQHFYTDAVGNLGAFQTLSKVWPTGLRPKPVKRLLGRRLPEQISPLAVTTTPLRTVLVELSRRLALPIPKPEGPAEWLRRKMLADGFAGANALYSLDNADLELVREAKRRGMFVVYEQIINADVGRIMREERKRFPGIEAQDSEELVENGIRRDVEIWNLSDVVLAPSEFVQETIARLGGPVDRTALVPYGVDASWLAHTNEPQVGRVLFVGTVGLRKGNHYLAEAARLLRERNVPCEVRVVGPHQPDVIARPEFHGPTYVGQVPRSEVVNEFSQADVFVLPTLSESFALVHLEAMACGVPVITTPNCGSTVRDGQDGFIVPIRDANALAAAIERVISDRTLRNRLSASAKERAADFVWKRYGERLVGAIHDAVSKRGGA